MSYTALIVDDESIERDGIESLIKQYALPFQVQKACNGQDAYTFLKKGYYDVLITDIKMPIMDGLQLSEKAKDLYPEIIILVFSAYSDFNFMHKAIEVKVEDYIIKPLVINEFIRIMKNTIYILDERRKKETKRQEILDKYKEASLFEKEKYLLQIIDDEQDYNLKGNAEEVSEKKVITDVIKLIDNNYNKDIGLEWIAQKVFLSTTYLSSLFKRETGRSITQYITFCRLEQAKKLLVDTNMKIVDICQIVGYNNPSYFGLIFRKYFGLTANQIREQDRD